MCEANVYLLKDDREELLMEKVDRVLPGADDIIVLESIFGERQIVKGRIKEMELVRHRIVLEEVRDEAEIADLEIWLEPVTEHGHFHPGEKAVLRLFKGHNMQPLSGNRWTGLKVFLVREGMAEELDYDAESGEIDLGAVADGLVTVWACQSGEKELSAKVIVEVGHHHHHGVTPVGLPLEIVPLEYGHVHLGDKYRFQVLKGGEPLAGAEVGATYTGSRKREYPVRLKTDEEGRAGVLLTARGNWLFVVREGLLTSTYTLVKSF